jgi:hypothetical protein
MTTATGLDLTVGRTQVPSTPPEAATTPSARGAVSAGCDGRRAGKARHKQKEDGRDDDIVGRG